MAKATVAKRAWVNRIVREAEVDPATLTPNPLNYRRHPKAQREAIAAALSRVGWVQRVIVNERSGNVIDGHARVEQALSRGEPTVPALQHSEVSLDG